MKLVDKFTLWYLSSTLIILPINSYITYSTIRKEIDNAVVERLKHVNEKVAGQVKIGAEIGDYTQGCRVVVAASTDVVPVGTVDVTMKTVKDIPELRDNDQKVIVSSYHNINNKLYKITSADYVTRSEQILAGLREATIWKLVILLLFVTLTARLMSRYVLAPFYLTLKKVQRFNVKSKQKLDLPPTRTNEFNELNTFLEKMSDKAVKDYASLKEFTENASHELQTPLAIIRSKLELLSESDIQGEQAQLIGDMNNAVEKLTRINRSLVLLSRLENNEYEATEEVSISQYTKEALTAFCDLMAIKSLQVTQDIEEDVNLRLHASLADILLNNLISNAIRHNVPEGSIEIILNREYLMVKNTGKPPTGPTSEMFQRFRKGSHCNNSIGIGLSIVKQICDLNAFDIQYHYASGLHIVVVNFPPESPASKLLQNDERYLHEKIRQ